MYVKNCMMLGDSLVKEYENINIEDIKLYLAILQKKSINYAKLSSIDSIDGKVILKQKYIKGKNIDEFLLLDSLKNNRLSPKSFCVFKKFIKLYFKKFYALEDISIDCKLSNFMMKNFVLVDLVPALFNKNYNENKNSVSYVCFNKDTQVKNIISYWLKYYIKYSYKNLSNSLEVLEKDFNKMFCYVKRFYNPKNFKDQNAIEKKFCGRFELLLNISNFAKYEDFLTEFLNNGFYNAFENKSNEEKIFKVHLIGGAGIGKSFTTNILKKYVDFKIVNLDNIYWNNKSGKFGVSNALSEIDRKLRSELDNAKNILVEGSYIDKWIYPSFDICDKIYVISTNYKLEKKRIVRRFIRRKLGIEKCKFKETFKSLNDLLKWTKEYDNNLQNFLSNCKEEYKNKFVFVNSTYEILYDILGN